MKEIVTVFLGSTYSDLKDHREEVLKALQKLKVHVNVMEYFGAQADPPINVCLEQVRKSSLYIGLFAMKYGSIVEGTGKSFTQLEYEEAQKLKLPSLIYIIDEGNLSVLPEDIDIGDNAKKLIELKEILRKKFTVSSFTTPDNLAKRISQDLPEALEKNGLNEKDRVKRQDKYLNNLPSQDAFVVGRGNDLQKNQGNAGC